MERETEEDENHRREDGGENPEAPPLIERQRRRTGEEAIVDVAGDLRPDEHADTVRDEDEESLCLTANRCRRLLVDVDLSGDVEGGAAELLERVDADDAACRHRLSPRRRRRVWKREAERGEDEARDPGADQRKRCLLRLYSAHEAAQTEADEQPGDDPADSAPH